MNGITDLITWAAHDQLRFGLLLHDRVQGVRASGIQLTPAEVAVLNSVDNDQLALMVRSVRDHPPRPAPPQSGLITGIMPDRPPARTMGSLGIQPDRPLPGPQRF